MVSREQSDEYPQSFLSRSRWAGPAASLDSTPQAPAETRQRLLVVFDFLNSGNLDLHHDAGWRLIQRTTRGSNR